MKDARGRLIARNVLKSLKKMLEINKVYNQDCLDFLKQIDNESIDLVIVDPPYNLQKFDYGNQSDFQGDREYKEWCKKWITEIGRVLKREGSLYCWTSRQYVGFFQEELSKLLQYRNTIIWSYGRGAQYRKELNYGDRYEPCLFFTKSDAYCFNKERYFIPFDPEALIGNVRNLKLLAFYKKQSPEVLKKIYQRMKEHGKFMINVWDDIGHLHNNEKITGHLNEKPVRLIERCVLMSSNEGDLVLDCFGGSGTTYMAALKNKRNYIGCEIEENWHNKICQRIQNYNSNLKHGD